MWLACWEQSKAEHRQFTRQFTRQLVGIVFHAEVRGILIAQRQAQIDRGALTGRAERTPGTA